MNLPVILAALSAAILVALVASTDIQPAVSGTAQVSEAARAALFVPSPIAERDHHHRRGYRAS